jgi:methylaspartate mutase epsilon subunit
MGESVANIYSVSLGLPKVQPRGGRSTVSLQSELWQKLANAGADILPLTIDSNTRLGKIDKASELYEMALKTSQETLNGFPLLSIPRNQVREMLQEVNLPVSLRHGTPLPLNLVRRALDVGVSEVEGGPISYTLPYSRDVNLLRCLEDWKLTEFECRNSSEKSGIKIIRESFGVLTACLVPPSQALISGLLETTFTLEFDGGIPMVSFGATGCEYQDSATISAFRILLPWWLDLIGEPEQECFVAFHQWMGPFPLGKSESIEIIRSGTIIATRNNCHKIVTKTIDEAHGVPTPAINSEAVKLVKRIISEESGLAKIDQSHDGAVKEECAMLVLEVKKQMLELFKLGRDVFTLILESIDLGYVDPPFSPHVATRGNLRTIRAEDGSIRVSRDNPGRHSETFLAYEANFLKGKGLWKDYSSDEISKFIAWPCYSSVKNESLNLEGVDLS